MAYTTAEDWLDRFVAAGCRMRFEGDNMFPASGSPSSPQCEMIWSELKRDENKPKWDEVLAEMKMRSETGKDYPQD